jgi:hypothetical protein
MLFHCMQIVSWGKSPYLKDLNYWSKLFVKREDFVECPSAQGGLRFYLSPVFKFKKTWGGILEELLQYQLSFEVALIKELTSREELKEDTKTKSDKCLFTMKYITVQQTKVKNCCYKLSCDKWLHGEIFLKRKKNCKRELLTMVFLVNSFNCT